jgi:hypothetical protein
MDRCSQPINVTLLPIPARRCSRLAAVSQQPSMFDGAAGGNATVCTLSSSALQRAAHWEKEGEHDAILHNTHLLLN